MSFFRFLRLAILVTILIIVAAGQWLTRSRIISWEGPVWMTVYPVVSSGDRDIRSYVAGLTASSFGDIGKFLETQGGRYGQRNPPLKVLLARPVEILPPPVPPRGSRLRVAVWSLKMRWWSWRRDREDGLPSPDVQMFVLYRKTGQEPLQERSVGVQKGMYGVVNASASRSHALLNRVVIAHELLHVLGATDKYDMESGQPLEPAGLGDPGQQPRYPQTMAEIMAVRIARSSGEAVMPASLASCVIGPKTAGEIGWL